MQSAPGDIQDGPLPTGRPTFQSSRRPRRHKPGSDPQPGDPDRTGRGGAGWPGRGGDAVARAGERASAQRAPEVRRPPRRSAPLGSARLGSAPAVPGVGRGARAETQRTGRPLLRHFLPARGFRREREARFCYWFFFLPSLSRDASPWPGCRLWRERSGPSVRAAARVGAGGREAAGSGPRRWGGRGVSARAPETKLLLGLLIFPAASPRRSKCS